MLLELSSQLETDNLRKDHRDNFTEHDSLSFDTTDTPAGNTETVDHGSVRVSADNGVGVEEAILVEDNTSEVFKVDLMHNT